MLASASPRACRVCRLPPSERDLLEGASLSGWSARSVAERFGTITRRDITGHMSTCVNERESEEA
jgi:hypothetical protein